MAPAVKVVVGVLAVFGALYLALNIYAITFLPHCQIAASGMATSPNSRYNAVFEQRVCEDPAKSRSTVLVGARNVNEKWVATEVAGTNDVKLEWRSDSRLVVSYPGARAREIHGMNGWPLVEIRTPAPPQ